MEKIQNVAPKKILFLGAKDNPLLTWLLDQGECVVQTQNRIDAAFIHKAGADFLLSYGYRHILKKESLDAVQGRAVNLHISFLPWNRGADPNFWSFVENTPKGVSIHYIDEGVDTGNILVQKEVLFDEKKETLSSSYEILQKEIQELFKENWARIRLAPKGERQKKGGSLHRLRDKEQYQDLLIQGWETPVELLKII